MDKLCVWTNCVWTVVCEQVVCGKVVCVCGQLCVCEQVVCVDKLCVEKLCVCVRNPESKGKAGGPWTHRWHGPTKTHLCRRENVPASEMARWPSQKPPMPTCHDMT